jgi:hypothetical protein
MKNQNSREHHIKRLETDQSLQETDIRIEILGNNDQVQVAEIFQIPQEGVSFADLREIGLIEDFQTVTTFNNKDVHNKH